MHDAGERVDRLAVDQDIEPDQVALAVFEMFIVHRSVPAGHAFDLVMKIHHDLVERDLGGQHHPPPVERVGFSDQTAFFHDELHHVTDIFVRTDNKRPHVRFRDVIDLGRIREENRVVHLEDFAVGFQHPVNHARIRRDDVHVELAPQPFLDNLHVEQAEKPAAKPEPERRRTLCLVLERGIVETKLGQGRLEPLVIAGIDRVQATEHHRMNFLEPGQRLPGRLAGGGDGIADIHVRGALDIGDDIADRTVAEIIAGDRFRGEHADFLDLVILAGAHQADLAAALYLAAEHADMGHHPAIRIEHRIEHERPQAIRVLRRRLWWWDPLDNRLQDLGGAEAGLGAGLDRGLTGDGEDLLELAESVFDVGVGQVHLVQDRDNDQAELLGQVDIGHRLGLDALGGVDHQQRALAGGQAARYLVRKIDVTRRVDQVQLVGLPVGCPVRHRYRVGFDGDPAFAFEIHRVQHLVAHFTLLKRAGGFQQTIRQGGLAVVDVGDNAEISYLRQIHGRHTLAMFCGFG